MVNMEALGVILEEIQEEQAVINTGGTFWNIATLALCFGH